MAFLTADDMIFIRRTTPETLIDDRREWIAAARNHLEYARHCRTSRARTITYRAPLSFALERDVLRRTAACRIAAMMAIPFNGWEGTEAVDAIQATR